MVFPPEREAAYVQRMFGWQRVRLRRLVLLAPPLLLFFVAVEALLLPEPLSVWLQDPLLYAGIGTLLAIALWMRSIESADVFAWAGVSLQTLFLVFCALTTRPGHGGLALLLPMFVATPLVTAPFFARSRTVFVAIVTAYAAGALALWHSGAGSTVWLAYGIQSLAGGITAMAMHGTVDHARRNYFLAEEELAQRATLDALTSVLNRRHFIESGEAMLQHMRLGQHLSACFIDLDHFKRVNDQGGHRIGDQLLTAVAQCLLELEGQGRLIGRVGGEEFALLLPATRALDAERITLEVCERIAGIDVEGFSCTASVGIAEWHPGESLSDLLHRADLALLAAKRNGRNRIELWREGIAA
ncbi:MAG TPA: GGDEF domain-containing protein [Lysobacter sp.]|jgi:diguanylate cyclase (GGDEF)-like protein|nr:GGDEF domain-containing protein [Lysobacter sp.]